MNTSSSSQGQPLLQPHVSNSNRSCQICLKPLEKDNFISCNTCQWVFHFACVNITNPLPTWNCANCKSRAAAPHSPRSVRSHRSCVSNSSSSRRQLLELQQLEEETQLQRDFIRKKYQILHQTEEDDVAAFSTNSIHEWLNNQPDPTIPIPTTEQQIPSSSANPFLISQPPCNQNITSNSIYTFAGQPTHQTLTSTNNNVNKNQASSLHDNFSNFIQNQMPSTSFHSTINNAFRRIPADGPEYHPGIAVEPTQHRDQTFSLHASYLPDPNSSAQNNLTHQQMNARHTVPKELPAFSGAPEEWPLFNSTFEWSTVVCGLTDAENLIRLQKALRGEALKSVQQILIHPSCVPAAMSTLKMLYGQPEKIVTSLKNKIKNLPTVNVNKLETITSFAIEVKGLQTIIEACFLHDELNNSSLLHELISKLPNYLQLNWGTHKINLMKNNKKANIKEFAEWIYDIGISANSVNLGSSRAESTEHLSRVKPRDGFVHTHSQRNRRSCVICDGDCRNPANCSQFLEADRNERWNMVRRYQLCKLCLFRHFGECKRNSDCGVDGCKIKHNSLLHRPISNEKEKLQPLEEDQNKEYNVNAHSGENKQILFKILPIKIFSKDGNCINTFAFIDEGSSISLVNEDIVRKLNIYGDPEPLCLRWTNNMERSENNSQRISIQISGPNNKKYSIEIRTVKNLSLPSQSLNYQSLANKYKYLKGLPIDSYKDAIPTVLIGLNNINLCTQTRIREGGTGKPTAICTRLGWLVCGNINHTSDSQYSFHICDCSSRNDEILHDLMKQFYKLETAGISNGTKLLGKEDQRALSILENHTSQRPDGHYETSLLWRFDNIELPDSYRMAYKRLICLEKSIVKNKDLLSVFQRTIAEYLDKKYISIIDTTIKNTDNRKVWYLPIFPVFNRNKPNKTRIVWDAAAKSHGVSLNSMLLKGPDLLACLPAILFRFRQKQIAVCGDIEQMFHQIFIRREDCDAQRFLWRDCDPEKEPRTYVMNVMIFGASCAPCISQYIKNVNASKFEGQCPAAAAAIKDNHYVDDFLVSTDTVTEAKQLSIDVRYIHSQGGFNIRNWCSNSSEVLKELSAKENCDSKCLNIGDSLEPEKVLGVFWVPSDDIITFKISPNLLQNTETNNDGPTKRKVLKVLMSIYDPLGLIGNFLMYLKIVLQEIWRSSVGWDEPIMSTQAEKWEKWLSFLPQLLGIKIPRCYLHHISNYNEVDVQLHTFVDASENGYAAVSYFRISNNSSVAISLIGSKTRVAPLKLASIPRLELMAAVIGARFASTIAENHTINIKKKIFWSDSRTVLSWIRSDHRKYHQFVAIRVSEILDISNMNEWRWISGKMNVADDATKWSKSPDLSHSSRWLNGPEFLRSDESEWPTGGSDAMNTELELKEHILVAQRSEPMLIEIERFSRWCRLLRSMAFVVRFVERLKSNSNKLAIELTQEELRKAEKILLQEAQKVSFLYEITNLNQKKNVPKSSPIYKLSPFIDKEGVLRVNGRIGNANVPEEMKFPAILPRYHYITELLILHYHCLYQHGNNETVINELRQRYHIPKLRVLCKSIIKSCQMCKVKKAVPQNPQMAKLPRSRLASYVAPFTFTGLDFFGPMMVTVNRHREKRYGALFTCLTIRAVHIEVVNSLNTSSCIMAIRNFAARRGTPREFFSDNGTNFVGAERELRQCLKDVDKNELIRNFTTATTKWNFNPPSAPHMGGAWERLVRSVKTVLYKIFPERCPSDEALRSMMAEVENILNSRPLTYVSVDEGSEEALTPNHFLLGSTNGLKPLAVYDDTDVLLRESWLCAQQYAERFWKRWVAEYLPTLTCRTKWFEKAKPLEVGDLVVVVDPSNPRNVWPRGRVIEVRIADDGQVRRAKVMTSGGVLERPAVKLAILDVAQKKTE